MQKRTLGEKFKQIVSENSDAIAVQFSPHLRYSYAELDELSDKFANLLIEREIGRSDVVSISGIKDIYTYALLIGCLKIGAVYSIYDPESPQERLNKIWQKCQPKLVVDEAVRSEMVAELAATPLKPIDVEVNHKDAAYIMFTSGSTGFPKGAVMTHDNVLRLIEWSRTTFGFVAGEVLTNVNPLYFDNSVFDIYSALFTGATLVPIEKSTANNPGELVKAVEANGCTSWFSVPSMLIFLTTMKAFSSDHFESVRRFIFGGEAYPKSKLKLLFDQFSKQAKLWNVYGPTECSCIATAHEVIESDFDDMNEFVTLGEVVDEFGYRVVDEELEQVVDGMSGELLLSGKKLGLGYYNDDEQTRTRFVIIDGERYYRTGDLVYVNEKNGKLYFQGRIDNQIKHMGYRIELEEIECGLENCSHVERAAVVYDKSGRFGKIVALVAVDGTISIDDLREELKEYLPDYMLPHVILETRLLPTNANGKLDRGAVKEMVINGELE